MKTINESKKTVKENNKFIFSSIMLAILVNVISNALLLDKPSKTKTFIIFISVILIFLLILFYLISILKSKTFEYNFRGMFSIDPKTNKGIEINHYDYSEDISRFLNSVFNENPALEHLWNKEPLKISGNHKDFTELESCKLLKEATEYYIVNKLSLHLSDYFNRKDLNLCTLKRQDVSNIIVTNRFLDMLSKDMSERPAFKNEHDNSKNIVFSMGANNIIYEHFDMKLPKGSKIVRTNSNEIKIETKRFKFYIEVDIPGFNTFVDPTFNKIFKKDYSFDMDYLVLLNFKIKFKPFAFILPLGNDYYNWVENFINKINLDFSIDEHLKNIGWEKNKILFEYLLNNHV